VLLVLLLPEGAGVATTERSQRCRKQFALGQPPESRNRFQSYASFLFLALLKLSSKKKKTQKFWPPAVAVEQRRAACRCREH
jgi:hypothetical protein